MKSIETIAFCTDLKQCKAMQDKAGEYFYSYTSGDGQVTKATKKLINEGQVRKWYKRNKKMMAIAEFKKRGCQYAQPQWQKPAAEERQTICGIAKFGKRSIRPWAKVDRNRVLKVFNQAGKIAEEGSNEKCMECEVSSRSRTADWKRSTSKCCGASATTNSTAKCCGAPATTSAAAVTTTKCAPSHWATAATKCGYWADPKFSASFATNSATTSCAATSCATNSATTSRTSVETNATGQCRTRTLE